ncbi:MAG: histidine kinase, partial [Solirubrobacteraceae bacterium]
MSHHGVPEPVEGNGGAPSNGAADMGGGGRVPRREVADGHGQPDASGDSAHREDQWESADFRVLALTSQLDAAQRVAAAGNVERERIERDLHDGAQQRLTALRIRLALAAEDFEARGDAAASAALNQFGEEVERAIDELREFVQGVYPVLLTSGGLTLALAAAGRGAQSVTVHASGVGRYATGVETAVYFCCLAALDNAAKHAGPSPVTIDISDQAGELRFTISDSGRGFDPHRATTGAGIPNMRDRMTAVGGTLTIESTPAHGTVIE